MSLEAAIAERKVRNAQVVEKTHDFLVFIGRFQPYHNGHRKVIVEALQRAKHVIVLVGSADAPRSCRNPFTYQERAGMIAYDHLDEVKHADRLHIAPLCDAAYNNTRWMENVQDAVRRVVEEKHEDFSRDPKIGLIGFSKDSTSFYLRMFQQWDSFNVEGFLGPKDKILSATHLREPLFSNISDAFIAAGEECMPTNVVKFLLDFVKTDDYKNLTDEFEFIRKYRSRWIDAPYPPTFVTADALVLCGSYVLLVKRGAHPGKGLWAMPGGFIKLDETIEAAALRELREETHIAVTDEALRAALRREKTETFDDPFRDPRGRFITHCFLFNLTNETRLPKVLGSDDAAHAEWVPLNEIERKNMAMDHYDIAEFMIAQV